MTDLSNKFASFEDQIASQHTELMNALNNIAFALGAPPTTPATNLEDLYTQMTALINGLALIYNANTTFHTANLATLSAINVNTDTLITNSSLNAQRLIAALYATFCACETTAPLLEPPLEVTPTPLLDDAKCRRIQFYLAVFGEWLSQIANYGRAGAAITGSTIAALLSSAVSAAGIVAVGAEVGAPAGPPGIIVGAAVGLITVAVYTLGGAVLVDYANQFNASILRNQMLLAMYAADNADEGNAAFRLTLLAGMDTIPAEIIYTLWWSAWSNDIYSDSPVVDDSAFDGTICAPPVEPACDEYTSALSGGYAIVHWAETYSDPSHTTGNWDGYRFRLVATSTGEDLSVTYYNTGGGYAGVAGDYLRAVNDFIVISGATGALGIYSRSAPSSCVFTIEVCPPGSF